MANHLDYPCFQPFDLFAQHAGLPLLKAHGAATVAAGQLHSGQQFSMAFKKVRCVRQKVGNVVFGDGMFSGIHVLIFAGF